MTAIDYDAIAHALEDEATAPLDVIGPALRDTLLSGAAAIRALRAALAESERDAGRYWWLRNQASEERSNSLECELHFAVVLVCAHADTYTEMIDTAIDAAMAAQEKANG